MLIWEKVISAMTRVRGGGDGQNFIALESKIFLAESVAFRKTSILKILSLFGSLMLIWEKVISTLAPGEGRGWWARFQCTGIIEFQSCWNNSSFIPLSIRSISMWKTDLWKSSDTKKGSCLTSCTFWSSWYFNQC